MAKGEFDSMKNITISKRNTKIGKIASLSLPTKKTCIGMTEWCGENCYAERAEIQYPAVLPSYVRNLEAGRAHQTRWFSHILKKVPSEVSTSYGE